MEKKDKAVYSIMILLVLFGVLALSDADKFDNSHAWTHAQLAVKSRLKSPSTAKFCSYSKAQISNSGGTYTVKGYVDAQNGFGATIRTNFTVTLGVNEAVERVSVISVTMY